MKRCSICGKYNSDSSAFCAECGNALIEKATNNNTSHRYENNPFENENPTEFVNNPFKDEEQENKQNTQSKTKTDFGWNSSSDNRGYTQKKPAMSSSDVTKGVIIALVAVFGIPVLITLFFVFITVIMAVVSVPVAVADSSKVIKVGKSTQALLEMSDYEDIEDYLHETGFYNVSAVGEEDIVYGSDYEDGSVIEVDFNGDTSFKASDEYPKGTKITITYHSPAYVEIESSSSYIGKDYDEVVEMLHDAGFYNIELEEHEDLIIGFLNSDGEVESIEIDGSKSFYDGEEFLADTLITITFHTFPD